MFDDSIINQKYKKKPGDVITYYEIIGVEGKRIKYVSKYDKLQGKEE